jgi:Family of unknown function (DUF5317)
MSIKKIFTFFGWPLLLIPTLVLWTGLAMNEICLHANNGRMPVYSADCATLMAAKEDIAGHEDFVHVCMTKQSKFRWMGDIFVSDDGISSVGDIIQEFSSTVGTIGYILWVSIGLFCLIRKEKFYAE